MIQVYIHTHIHILLQILFHYRLLEDIEYSSLWCTYSRISLICFIYSSVYVCVLSCVKLFCDPMCCSPPVPAVCGILQARMLEWVAMPFSRGSS